MIQYSIYFIFCILLTVSYATVQEFCIADMSSPENPIGFDCKKPSSVTVKDFIFSMQSAATTKFPSIFNTTGKLVGVDQFPGLNGLGISLAPYTIGQGGSFPLHTHPTATEIYMVLSGSMDIGFISLDNTLYTESLKEGDIMVIPQGLLHYNINSGGEDSVGISVFNNEKLSFQVMDFALFGNALKTDTLAKVTYLDPAQIKKLKAQFGGQN